jgi:MraZ protein
MFTVVISVKVREGNRCAAEVDKGPIAVVPVVPVAPPPDKPMEMKPLPQESSEPLPKIGEATFTPRAPQSGPLPSLVEAPTPPPMAPSQGNSTIETTSPIEIKQASGLLPAVQPGPPASFSEPPAPAPMLDKPLTTYTVVEPGGENLLTIGQKTLKSPDGWIEIKKLNPTIDPEKPVSTGTVLVMPGTATIPVVNTPRFAMAERLAVVAPTPTSYPAPALNSAPKLSVATPVAAPAALSSIAEPGEPPLAPQPGPVVQYHVKQGGEYLKDVARKTLGSSERCIEVSRLNPALSQDAKLTSGTVVRLPADACIPTEELQSVQPLPALRPFKPEPGKPKAVMPLTGTFPCNLDDQHALLLPKSMRDQLGSIETLMVSPGADQCLWLTTPAHLERLAQRLEQSQAKEVDVRTFKRLYYAQTEKVSLTAEGRVVISDRLATFAGLHQEVVLVGIDDHFELWDVSRWKDFTQKKSAAARATIAAEQE